MSSSEKIVESLRNTFASGRTKSLKWRKIQLSALIAALEANEQKMCEAIEADIHKPKFETCLTEIQLCISEAYHAIANLNSWAKSTKLEKNFLTMMNDVYVEPEPLGVSLILGAWNFPFQLCLCPMIAAIAAGNCVVLKPSELTPKSAICIEQVISESLDGDAIKVVTGGVPLAQELLACRFDHICYTGGVRVGKLVMEAAAKFLTPVLLELGGKCPVFVDSDVDFEVVANRIAWGKTMNCGQVCLAPDYIITTADVQPKLIKYLKRSLRNYFGDDVENSKDYTRIVNDEHFRRLHGLLNAVEPKVVSGGKVNHSTRFIEPTIIADISPEDDIMKEEIFGPLLPILVVENFDEAIRYINKNEKPLALYVFSKSKEQIDLFKKSTSSGAFSVNDVVMHPSVHSLPFGGVGYSGMGAYHGKNGFDAMSHMKPCYIAAQAMESFNVVRYPPYTDEKLSVIRFVDNTESALHWLFKPLVWVYIFVVFLVRLATLPRTRPHHD